MVRETRRSRALTSWFMQSILKYCSIFHFFMWYYALHVISNSEFFNCFCSCSYSIYNRYCIQLIWKLFYLLFIKGRKKRVTSISYKKEIVKLSSTIPFQRLPSVIVHNSSKNRVLSITLGSPSHLFPCQSDRQRRKRDSLLLSISPISSQSQSLWYIK